MGDEKRSMEDLGMNAEFWRNKNVLITGHTGFKGSWLSLWLQELHANVIGLSLEPPSTPNLFSAADVASNMISIIGDVRDFHLVKTALANHQPEIIIHMAAQSLVRYSYQNPIETYATNVMGTVNLLEAARQTATAKAIINVTSDKCYENKEWLWGYREHDVLGGHDPYSNSKACAELVTAAFRNSYGKAETACGIASVRAGNVIGGGDWAQDRLIPDVMRGIFNRDDIILRYPHALRPWQHVLDPLHGYLQLAEQVYANPAEFAEAWNFGPNEQDVKSVGWVVDTILTLWDKNLSWKLDQAAKPHEATYLKLDSAKAKSKLGWKPRWNLEKALQETVGWYRAYQSEQNMRDKTRSQINEYSSLG